jgi:hypothetical protein
MQIDDLSIADCLRMAISDSRIDRRWPIHANPQSVPPLINRQSPTIANRPIFSHQ